MDDPRRIALVRLSHLGDVVLALPLFHAVRERFPGARLAWVVQSEFAGLVDGLPGLERVVRFERRGGARAWLALRRELGEFGAQLALDAQGNWKSAAATLATGAPRRIGLAPADWRERGAWLAMTEFAAPLGSEREHAMDRTRALCEHLGAKGPPRRDAALSIAELEHGRTAFDRLVGGAQRGVVLVQLSAPDDVRSWPLEHSLELASRLAEAGRHVLLLSGPSEAEQGRLARERLAEQPAVRHWVGQRGLRELAAVLTAAAESGARYVGCDTGPTHLAAACGLPVALLAGPQSHLRTGPWPVAEPSARGASPHLALRSPRELDCAPCLARSCRRTEGPVCMSDVTPSAVLAALERT